MIEFAAGIMVGGSVGAVIMGALLTQARSMTADLRGAVTMQARAPMQVPQHVAARSALHLRGTDAMPNDARSTDAMPMMLHGRQVFAAASSQLH